MADTDLIAIREENGGPTFAAVTARSFTPAASMPYSATEASDFVKNSIAGVTWSAARILSWCGGEAIE